MVEINPNWTIEEACAANEEALQKDPQMPSRIQPLAKWAALQDLMVLERCFTAGDKQALLDAIGRCALQEITMPDWVVTGFLNAYRSFTHHRVKTLGDAFGVSQPKGKHLNAARKKREKAAVVWSRVNELSKRGAPIDDSLFEAVGRELSIGKTLVSEYYYHFKRLARPDLK